MRSIEEKLKSILFRSDCPSNMDLGEYELGILDPPRRDEIASHLVDGEMRIANMDGRPPVAMRFQDSDNGIIVLALAGRGDTQFLALHTDDGGQSWSQYDLPLNLGPIYLSHDGRFLTVTELGGAGTITIMENQLLAE